ncbi:MAG: protein kinase [Deltaproteobacteria bacterium]|nr:protein kinase [Deltaproteobacteria bacterium]
MQPDFTGLVLEGKYRLTAPLGAGGMGYVWRAEHVQLGRPFAVKLLRPELVSDPTALARFQQEAQAAARIGSRHIVDVLDVGRTPGGAPYLVMEFLQGRSLSAELESHGPLPLARAIDLAGQILDGLAAAHAAGIVHRDLKPDNVFLLGEPGARDDVKLLDFGISKAKDDPRAQHLTRTGMLLGTPRYMSPEQVLGRRDVDRRADLWAAGVILYECLTGRVPFDAPDLATTLTSILQQTPVPPAAYRPEIEPRLGAAVLRALAKNPAERFADVAAFKAALAPAEPGRAAAGATAVAPPSDPTVEAAASVMSTPDAPLGGRVPDWSPASGPTPSWAPAQGPPFPGTLGTASLGSDPGRPGPWTVPPATGSPTVPAAAPSLAPQRPPTWPWLLGSLLVLGVAVAAVWFLAAQAGDDPRGAAAGPDGAPPGPAAASAATDGAPAGPAAAAPAQVVAPEDLTPEQRRARWVRVQADFICAVSDETRRTGKPPLGRDTMRLWQETCARAGLELSVCNGLNYELAGDLPATEEVRRRTRRCLLEAHGLDAGLGEPDGGSPMIPRTPGR